VNKATGVKPGSLIFVYGNSMYRLPSTLLYYKIDRDDLAIVVSVEKKPYRITCLRSSSCFVSFDKTFTGFHELVSVDDYDLRCCG
jgi:hypothetical protein